MATPRKIQNLQTITVGPEAVYGEAIDADLARKLVSRLMGSPKPEPDEFGISSFREIWVLFTPEGSDPRELPAEAEPDVNQWLNAFSLVRPSDSFLQDFEQDLRSSLKQLFEGSEFLPQRKDLLFRIGAS